MRILTFNSHQPYVHLLATALPADEFGVVQPRLPSGKIQSWDVRVRPLPENVRLFSSVPEALHASSWDQALAHNVHDLLDCRGASIPKTFVVHGTLTGRIIEEGSSLSSGSFRSQFAALLGATGCRLVYISELKRADWGLPGTVIRSGIDADQYGDYRGEKALILRVCNHLKERGAILGWQAHQEACRGLPALVLGRNRNLPGSRVPDSWDDLKEAYRSCRLYLSTAVHPYEDGYNLALLEAMASGMPIAALAHPTLPVSDGVEGVVATTGIELRARISRLLSDPAEARRLGEAGRKRIAREFSFPEFRRKWKALLGS